jgi:hypothetical protein
MKLEQIETKLESSLKDFQNRLVRDEISLKNLQKPVPVPVPVSVESEETATTTTAKHD